MAEKKEIKKIYEMMFKLELLEGLNDDFENLLKEN